MLKIEKILIGTHNKGKFKELSFLLRKKIKKKSPIEFDIKSPKETATTYLGNSSLKAKYFYKHSGLITISDDSGLSVNCLNGKPGIFSSRWAKKYGSFKTAMTKIIKMVNKKNKNRKAKFICSLTIQLNKKKSVSAKGEIFGTISKKILGKKGFGFDPIFIPKGQKITFGQMTHKKKILMDHRFIAFKKLKKKVKTL